MARNLVRALVMTLWISPIVVFMVRGWPPQLDGLFLLVLGVPVLFILFWMLSIQVSRGVALTVALGLSLAVYGTAVLLSALFLWFLPAALAAVVASPLAGSPPRAHSK